MMPERTEMPLLANALHTSLSQHQQSVYLAIRMTCKQVTKSARLHVEPLLSGLYLTVGAAVCHARKQQSPPGGLEEQSEVWP